jgi:hypothetical protein
MNTWLNSAATTPSCAFSCCSVNTGCWADQQPG